MKFSIKHEINGRFRIHVFQKGVMSLRQADLLQYYLGTLPGVQNAKVYERTADAVIIYKGDRNEILEGIRTFSYENKELEEIVPANSGRELNREYQEKLFKHVAVRMVTKTCFPFWLRAVYTTAKAVHYVFKGICCLLKGKLEVEVLDATAITVSIIRSDFNTAGSVMFLLGIGELLEEWTHKKSVGDLARSMSLNIEKVWQNVDGTEILVPVSNIKEGDLVTVHVGNVIPLDGEVINGEAMVNQASMTGESVPVKKEAGSYVYAGTAVEEAATVDFNQEAALRHPYTRALFRAMPEHGFAPEPGIQPYVRDLPEGCPYGPRCPKHRTECSREVPYVPYQGGRVRCICPGDESEILEEINTWDEYQKEEGAGS